MLLKSLKVLKETVSIKYRKYQSDEEISIFRGVTAQLSRHN